MKKIIPLLIMLIVICVFSVTVTSEPKKVKAKKEKETLVISKASVNNEDKSKEIISEDKKSIVFITDKLHTRGEKVVLNYSIKNKSKDEYLISMKCETSNKFKDYYSITNDYKKSIEAKSNIEGLFTLEMIKDSETSVKEIIMCDLSFIKK